MGVSEGATKADPKLGMKLLLETILSTSIISQGGCPLGVEVR